MSFLTTQINFKQVTAIKDPVADNGLDVLANLMIHRSGF